MLMGSLHNHMTILKFVCKAGYTVSMTSKRNSSILLFIATRRLRNIFYFPISWRTITLPQHVIPHDSVVLVPMRVAWLFNFVPPFYNLHVMNSKQFTFAFFGLVSGFYKYTSSRARLLILCFDLVVWYRMTYCALSLSDHLM